MEQAPQKIDVGAAVMELLSRAETMGANDSERSTLMNILQEYQEKKITAEDALKKAEGVVESKQDYH